jgi:orotidine-5'-phosphate decarboxylase
MKAKEKLQKRLSEQKHICVGLDTDLNKIPSHLKSWNDPIFEFNKAIIEATAENVCAYKINLAFYEKEGAKGLESLQRTLDIIPEEVFIIGDAKRGDIGNTSLMYAQSIFDHFNFDSVTLHPYMGYDSLKPFIDYSEKINFILALTSNPGSADFEKIKLEDGRFVYQEVINKVCEWNINENLGIVFGATNPTELTNEINNFNNLFILLPGIGAQGGSLEDVVKTFKDNNNSNFVINVSRGIIYCDTSELFSIKAAEELNKYNSLIQQILDS